LASRFTTSKRAHAKEIPMPRTRNRTAVNLAATILSAATLTAACSTPSASPVAETTADQVARGRRLVSMGGCNDCHTPMKFDADLGMPVPDMTRMLSGHPQGAPDPASTLSGHDIAVIGPTFTSFRLPFGVVYPANLTSDKDTGLGAWTEDMFVRAVRTGRHMGGNGRPILPPMPWMTLAQQSEADLKAIFAYLQTVPAIRNDVPAPKVPDAAMNGIAASYDKILSRMKGQASR
jgi:mono/diheme cytochrome c family protein